MSGAQRERAGGVAALRPLGLARETGEQIPAGVTRIKPGRTWASTLGDAWDHREILYFLVWRDLKVRYRQTVIGAVWAVVQPLTLMVVFVVFVRLVLNVPSDGLPYPLFVFAALLPWSLFSQTVLRASDSLVSQAHLISKVYVPRLLVPLAVAGSYVLDFLIAFAVLVGLMLYYSTMPSAELVWLPLLSVLALAVAAAVGAFAAALNVKYRDVQAVVPLLVQVWFFATPVAYPSSLVPEAWRLVYALNPMVGVVEGFRWALLPTDTAAPLGMVTISAVAAALLVALSLFYFRRVDRTFADVI